MYARGKSPTLLFAVRVLMRAVECARRRRSSRRRGGVGFPPTQVGGRAATPSSSRGRQAQPRVFDTRSPKIWVTPPAPGVGRDGVERRQEAGDLERGLERRRDRRRRTQRRGRRVWLLGSIVLGLLGEVGQVLS